MLRRRQECYPVRHALIASGTTAVLSSLGAVASTSGVTTACTVQTSSAEHGAVAEQGASSKDDKYSILSATHIFQPLVFEFYGPHSASVTSFIKELSHRISQRSGDDRETVPLPVALGDYAEIQRGSL